MNGEPSTSAANGTTKHPRPNDSKKDGKRPYRYHNQQPKDDAGATGISKLKASLRQTRRLLAKDTLAPNVRVQTERRLKSLEGDLARAELASKERTMAVKYHRVKFFDRQKLTRKIRQIKKQLSDPSFTSKKEHKALEETLFSLRVDLNYVLHYPKLEKYISLFPPEARSSSDPSSSSTTPLPIQAPADLVNASETEKKREELREEIRRMMREGGDGVSLMPEERESGAKGGKKEANVKKDAKSKVDGKKKVGDESEGSDEESDEEDEDVEMDEPDVGEDDSEEEEDTRPKKKSKSDHSKSSKPPPQSTTYSSEKKDKPASKALKDKPKHKSKSKSKAETKPSKAKAVSKPVEEEKDDFFMDDSD